MSDSPAEATGRLDRLLAPIDSHPLGGSTFLAVLATGSGLGGAIAERALGAVLD